MRTTVFIRAALLLLPVLIVLVSPFPVHAETPVLSLSGAIEQALRDNGELKAFREEHGLRDAANIRAGLLPNPTLDFEAATGALTGSKNEHSLALGLSQELLLAGKRGKRLAVAEQELEIHRWQVTDRERLLRENVTAAFYDALLAKERLDLADRAIVLNRRLLEVTQERLAAGDIPELELNLVKVELARGETTRLEAGTAMGQSQAKLWALLGLSGASTPAITGKLASGVPLTQSLPELQRLASLNRPDLMALKAETGRSEADMSLARAEAVPNLTAGLVFKRDATSMEIGGVEGRDTAYTIGVRFSLPIPVFDRNQAGVREAAAKKSVAALRLAAAERAVELEVRSAYDTYRTSAAVLMLYKNGVIPQVEENLKLTQEAYRLGETGILAVIQEQKKFIEINEGYLTVLHTRQTAFARLESVVSAELTGGMK